jgi:hypothetical protein
VATMTARFLFCHRQLDDGDRFNAFSGGSDIYPLMPLRRQCPNCQSELVYANAPGYQRAKRMNALCRSCAASPSVIQKRLAEAEEEEAKKWDGSFMAAFFENIEASLSGSKGR